MSDEELMTPEAVHDAIVEQAEDVTAVEPEGEAEPETDEAKEEKRKSSWRDRREAQKAARDRTLAELAETRAKLAEAERKIAEASNATQQAKRPNEAEFTDYAEYLEAVLDWKSGLRVAEQTKKEVTADAEAAKKDEARLQKQNAEILWQHWEQQASEAETRYADFNEVVRSDPSLFPIGSLQVEMIQASDVAADLAYRIA